MPDTPQVLWFVTGSQHLYGPETLQQVAAHSQSIAAGLNDAPEISLPVVFKPVLTTPDAIRSLCREASADDTCAGLITWMHTFSPAKMWIAGLSELHKPLLHLHTQFNRDIPWDTIDMDFMNLNQAAHGDREFGFIGRAWASGAKWWSGTGRPRRPHGHRQLGPRGVGPCRGTPPESGPLWRQYARSCRH